MTQNLRHHLTRPLRTALLASSLILTACSAVSGDPIADARSAYAKGDLPAARIHVENALQSNGADSEARLLQGTIMLDSGDAASAEVSLRKVMNDAKLASQVQEKLAEALIMQGKGEALLTMLDGKTALDPATVAYLRVGALQSLDRWDDADAALNKGLTAHPDNLKLQVTAADRALLQGNNAKAQTYADAMLKAAPASYEANLLAGRLASLQGDLKGAQQFFMKARTVRPNSIVVLYALGGIANDLGNPAEAEKLFAKAQAIRPKDPIANYFLAQMAFDKGDSEGADKILIDGDPAKAPIPQIAMLRGLIEAQRGRNWAAVPLLAPYVGNGGRDPRARYALAKAYVALNKPQEAWAVVAPLADAATAGPPILALAANIAPKVGKNPAPYQQRYAKMQAADPIAVPMSQAQAAMAAQRWSEADTIYTRLAGSGHAKLVPLLNNHALVKLAMSDGKGAVALARQARTLAPHDPIVADTLGWVIFKSGGSVKEAGALVSEAAAARPQDAEIADHLRAIKSAGGGN